MPAVKYFAQCRFYKLLLGVQGVSCSLKRQREIDWFLFWFQRGNQEESITQAVSPQTWKHRAQIQAPAFVFTIAWPREIQPRKSHRCQAEFDAKWCMCFLIRQLALSKVFNVEIASSPSRILKTNPRLLAKPVQLVKIQVVASGYRRGQARVPLDIWNLIQFE